MQQNYLFRPAIAMPSQFRDSDSSLQKVLLEDMERIRRRFLFPWRTQLEKPLIDRRYLWDRTLDSTRQMP